MLCGVYVCIREGRDPSPSSHSKGVHVEEVDIGDDLNSHSHDPNKELHYAELEHFRKPDLLPPEKKHKTVDEPVGFVFVCVCVCVCVCVYVCMCVCVCVVCSW